MRCYVHSVIIRFGRKGIAKIVSHHIHAEKLLNHITFAVRLQKVVVTNALRHYRPGTALGNGK